MTNTVHEPSLSGNKKVYLKKGSPESTVTSTGLGLRINTIKYAFVNSRELTEKTTQRRHANTKAPCIPLLCPI